MADDERSQNHEAQHANCSNMAVACVCDTDSRNACSTLEHSITNNKTPGRKVTTPSNGYIKHNYDENNQIHVVNDNVSAFGRGDSSHSTHESECQSKDSETTASDVSYQEKTTSKIETSCCKVDSDNVHNCYDSTEPCAATHSVDSVTNQLSHTSLSDSSASSVSKDVHLGIEYVVYESELQMPDIMRLITKDLSEPYSIYTYRYFIHNWPKLCFLAMDGDKCAGAIVCKLDMHKKMVRRGYIAMLAVDNDVRRRGIGSHLVIKAIQAMVTDDCDEVVLETEVTNKAALRLYENLGFVHDKRLFRYYLNGVDALRLKLWLR